MIDRNGFVAMLRWFPSLFFTKGLVQVVLTTLSVTVYKLLQLDNSAITFYVAWLYLPWVIKPLWKPFVDRLNNCRWWILVTELLLGAGLGGVAFTIPSPLWLQGTFLLLWLTAFASATHNEAVDNLFKKQPSVNSRAFLVKTLSQKMAKVVGQGVLVMLAGNMQVLYRNNIRYSWSLVFYIVVGLVLAAFLWHAFQLPNDNNIQRQRVSFQQVWDEFLISWRTFMGKPSVAVILLFLLLFRLPEALLGRTSILFLLDSMHRGGLGLSPPEYGLVMGTVGVVGLTVGTVVGHRIVRRDGLYSWVWLIAIATTMPHLGYVYLSYALPANLLVISWCLFVEQVGYGLGFSFYLQLLSQVSSHSVSDSHRTLCKSLMALSLMVPTMAAGALQTALGYRHFFLLVLLSCGTTFLTAFMAKKRSLGVHKK